MYIKSIQFENYRNLKNDIFFPQKGINVICGDNAQGKTNLIECMWLFTGGRSFRGAKDRELIRFEEDTASAEVCFFAGEREQTIKINIQNNRRTPILNGVPKSYMSQIIGVFCAVIFSPNHLGLIKNGPEERRNFIDGALCQIKPSYASVLTKYRRVLNERNALLKDIPRHPELEDTLDVWNEKLAEEGAKIAFERMKYLRKLSVPAKDFYSGISSGRENLSLSYKNAYYADENMNCMEIKETLLEKITRRQTDDIYCGYTTGGIHRDDMTIRINNRDAKSFASQGQQRSAVLALKLAEARVLGQEKKENPIILLDDVLSELDLSRQNYLLTKLNSLQVFITCCESSAEAGHIVTISSGTIQNSSRRDNPPP